MTTLETINHIIMAGQQAKVWYDLFMEGKITIEEFEQDHKSHMEEIVEFVSAERDKPNYNNPYTLNDGTEIPNKADRQLAKLKASLAGKVYFDVDPDFA